MQVNTKRAGSLAATSFGVILHYIYFLNNLRPTLGFSKRILKTFRPVIVVLNIAFKAFERRHQTQWQFSCHQIWCRVLYCFTVYSSLLFVYEYLYYHKAVSNGKDLHDL